MDFIRGSSPFIGSNINLLSNKYIKMKNLANIYALVYCFTTDNRESVVFVVEKTELLKICKLENCDYQKSAKHFADAYKGNHFNADFDRLVLAPNLVYEYLKGYRHSSYTVYQNEEWDDPYNMEPPYYLGEKKQINDFLDYHYIQPADCREQQLEELLKRSYDKYGNLYRRLAQDD